MSKTLIVLGCNSDIKQITILLAARKITATCPILSQDLTASSRALKYDLQNNDHDSVFLTTSFAAAKDHLNKFDRVIALGITSKGGDSIWQLRKKFNENKPEIMLVNSLETEMNFIQLKKFEEKSNKLTARKVKARHEKYSYLDNFANIKIIGKLGQTLEMIFSELFPIETIKDLEKFKRSNELKKRKLALKEHGLNPCYTGTNPRLMSISRK